MSRMAADEDGTMQMPEKADPVLKSVAKHQRGQNVDHTVLSPCLATLTSRKLKTRNFEETCKNYRNGLER